MLTKGRLDRLNAIWPEYSSEIDPRVGCERAAARGFVYMNMTEKARKDVGISMEFANKIRNIIG